MKRFLKYRSNRWGYDGWAVAGIGGAPWLSTVSTTREEARAIRKELLPDLFERTEVVKVKIRLEVV